MTLETLLTYGLRLWLAGLLHTGGFLLRVGPFGLAGAGFAGWQMAHAEPSSSSHSPAGASDESAEQAPAFTLR